MSKTRKKKSPKRVLALSDLEHAKSAVLNTLTSMSGQRTYDHGHQRLRRVVLLRAAPGLQSHGGPEIPDSLGAEGVRSEHHQSASCGGAPSGIRLGNWLTPAQGNYSWNGRTPARYLESETTPSWRC